MSLKWRDNSIRIFSLMIAILLWIYVTNEQNPVTDQTFTVPLVIQDEPQGYVVQGVPETVSIRVRGTRLVVGTLQRNDFSARVNLAGIKPGEQEVPVHVNSPPEVEVLQVSPAVIKVRADRMVQKNVPVIVSLKGQAARGMQAGEPSASPPVATLSGPSLLLKEINRLLVTVDITGAGETVVRELPLDTGLDNVTATPDRVVVTVPVTGMPTRSLPVRPRLTGAPATGYKVAGTIVQPQAVTVTAPENVFGTLAAVNTMNLDISGVTGNVTREVILLLPDGAHAVEPDRVEVTVLVEPVEDNRQDEQPPPEEEDDTGTG